MSHPQCIEPTPAAHDKGECWSMDEELFRAESLNELVNDHHDELEVGQTVWVADSVHPDPAGYIDVDYTLEQIGERAMDDCGEAAEDFPSVTAEARNELESLLKTWARKHCTVSFWQVKNVRPYVLTAEDLA